MNTIEERAAAMHAAIDRRLHEDPFALMAADLEIGGVAEATRYAPSNKHLLDDSWVAHSVAAAARDDDGIWGLPLDHAVIVRSQAFSTENPEDGGWHRRAEPLREDGGPLNQLAHGTCDRCDMGHSFSMAFGVVTVLKSLTTFHIARGQFVVEFGVCDECVHDMIKAHGSIVRAVPRGSV